MTGFVRAIRRGVLPCILLLASASTARATLVEYETSNVSGNTWRYDYTVTNDSLSRSIDELTIFFTLGLYENVNFGGAPAGWDALVIAPDPNLPDDGFYDALALGSGLAVGATLGGFYAVFDWLGSGTPGSQSFSVFDALTFDTLDVGFSVPRAAPPPTPVAEPHTLSLLIIAMLAAFGGAQRRRAGLSRSTARLS
jgi:hypothetical protein